jgi:hypothetical protein
VPSVALGLQPLRVFCCRAHSQHPIRPEGLPSNQKQTLAAGQRLQDETYRNRTTSVSLAWPSRAAALTPLTESAAKKKMLLCQRIAWQNVPLGKIVYNRGEASSFIAREST